MSAIQLRHNFVRAWTTDAISVVEFGAGFGKILNIIPPIVDELTGIEAHKPYLDRWEGPKRAYKIWGDMRDGLKLLDEHNRTCDIALFFDSLEHLTAADATALIEQLKTRFRRIIVDIPEGDHPQTSDHYHLGADALQTHRSTWSVSDMEQLGFTVIFIPDMHSEPGKSTGGMLCRWEKP